MLVLTIGYGQCSFLRPRRRVKSYRRQWVINLASVTSNRRCNSYYELFLPTWDYQKRLTWSIGLSLFFFSLLLSSLDLVCLSVHYPGTETVLNQNRHACRLQSLCHVFSYRYILLGSNVVMRAIPRPNRRYTGVTFHPHDVQATQRRRRCCY